MNIKHLILSIYGTVGLDRLFLNRQPRVLFYHGVAERIADARIESESIQADDFERQLKYIRKHFNPVSTDEFYERFISGKWEGREILLTFDDGYRNMLSTALPLLEKYDVPFILFLTVDNISDNKLFPTTINRLVNLASTAKTTPSICSAISTKLKRLPIDQVEQITVELLDRISPEELSELREKYSSVNPLNWEDCRRIAESSLCTIGSHCMSHICCHDNQNLSEVRRQFEESRKEIARRFNVPCDFLSYPNGNFTEEVKKAAESSGYKMAFSTKYEAIDRPETDRMAVGRIYVPYDFARFKYIISRFPYA